MGRTFQKPSWKSTLTVSNQHIQTIIEHKLDIKLGYFLSNKLDKVLKRNKKASDLDSVPPDV